MGGGQQKTQSRLTNRSKAGTQTENSRAADCVLIVKPNGSRPIDPHIEAVGKKIPQIHVNEDIRVLQG